MNYLRRISNIYDSLNLRDLDLQRKYRVSSIEHNSGIVRYESNDGIVPALMSAVITLCHYHCNILILLGTNTTNQYVHLKFFGSLPEAIVESLSDCINSC